MNITSVARSITPPFGPSPIATKPPIADRSFCDPRAGTLLLVQPLGTALVVVDPKAGTLARTASRDPRFCSPRDGTIVIT